MKKILFAFALALAVTACSRETSLKVGSYNIRYENEGDAGRGNGWEDRLPYVCAMLRYERPDIFGSQEVLVDQLHDMLDALPDYDCVGVGRDDGKEAGEFEPVFWRRDRFGLLDKGWFWLSETPEKPGLGWDAACIRICTWAYLKDKDSGKRIWFFNLHMDHVGVVARAESAKLIVRRIESMCKPSEYVFVTGDFNVDQANEIYGTFTQSEVLTDSYETAADRFVPNGTFNGYDPNSFTSSRIDHIFVSPTVTVDNYAVRTDTYRKSLDLDERYRVGDFPAEVSFERYVAKLPSDHFPVFIKVRL